MGAAPSPDKRDGLCRGFVARSRGNISKASSKSPGRAQRSSSGWERDLKLLIVLHGPAHGARGAQEPSPTFLQGSCPRVNRRTADSGPPVGRGTAIIRLREKVSLPSGLPVGLVSQNSSSSEGGLHSRAHAPRERRNSVLRGPQSTRSYPRPLQISAPGTPRISPISVKSSRRKRLSQGLDCK